MNYTTTEIATIVKARKRAYNNHTITALLTDSRSFSSYARFDFFRRILSDYLGSLVEKGECDLSAAYETAKNISYYNIKEALNL